MNRCPRCGIQFEGTGTGGPVACPLCDTYPPNAEPDELRTEVKRLRAALADALARAEDAEADFSRLKAEMQARTAAEAEAWEAEAWAAEVAARAAEAPGEASLQRRIAALEAVVSQFLAAHWVDVEADGQVVDHWNVRLLEEAAKAATEPSGNIDCADPAKEGGA